MANEPAQPTSDQRAENDPLWERVATRAVKILFRVYLAPFLILFLVLNYSAILVWRTVLLLEAGIIAALDATALVVDFIARSVAAPAGHSPWNRGFPHPGVPTLLHRQRRWSLLHNRASDK